MTPPRSVIDRSRFHMRVAASAVGIAGPVGLHVSGAPWWATLITCVLSLSVICLQTVFPQESADRLAWWKDRRRSQERKVRDAPALPGIDVAPTRSARSGEDDLGAAPRGQM
jgi:hypothetical protein